MLDASVGREFQQAERRCQFFALRNHAHADVRAALPVAVEQALKVHAIELIAGENQLIVVVAAGETMKVLAYSIGCALEPIGICYRLFGGEDFNETLSEGIKAVTVRDVVIQGRRVELRHDEDSLQPGIQTVADWDVDQPVLSA